MNDDVLRYYEARMSVNNDDDKKGQITGYASVYDQKIKIGDYFYEVIERGAFDNTDLSDVMFFVNHDDQKITLARSRKNKKSTMEVTKDDKGLKVDTTLDIERNYEASALFSAIDRGDIDGMSFRFLIEEERWEDLDKKMPIRYITKVKRVSEVSAVNVPAYSKTSIELRSKNDSEIAELILNQAREKRSKELEILKVKAKEGIYER